MLIIMLVISYATAIGLGFEIGKTKPGTTNTTRLLVWVFLVNFFTAILALMFGYFIGVATECPLGVL